MKPLNSNTISDIKLPPHSIEAEQAVMGSLLIDNEKWDRVANTISGKDFYSRHHQIIFNNMEEMAKQNEPIDLLTLSEHLENKNTIDDVGGFAYLAGLSKNTPSVVNVEAYANIIRKHAILRELISVSNEIADSCYSPEGRDSADLLDFAESKIFKIAESRTQDGDGPMNINDVLTKTIERIELISKNKDSKNGVTGLSTGFTDLDKKTAGLQNSDLIIVAARPSMGKTTFAMNLCENVAMAQKKPILIFSLEMPSEQIMTRMLASISRVDQTKIRTGQLNEDDWGRVSSSMGVLMKQNNIFIDDSSALTPMELRARARRIYRENKGLAMIMVDYLQLMRSPNHSDNRTLEIAEISRSLKALAKELNVPVVALSQLNRGLEQRADKRPINSDLRESGSIEQDADVIMFIYRDEVYNENSEQRGLAEIILGKQRNGPIGKVKLKFNGHWSRFDNYANSEYFDDE